jgi:hypothetical protein
MVGAMASHGSARGGRRTSLTVRQARAELVHRELLAHPVARVEHIGELARFARWDRRYLDAAVDDLIDAGVWTEEADGKLRVNPLRRA